ncbi:MAG: hypothetical protein HZC40_16530 [Chloroflexi bacterium]|nr:hypothetical protein [Chloroflexota bacterium]
MAQNSALEIPIVCENDQCENHGNIVNLVRGITREEIDHFYESYDESVSQDHCPICGELGVAEEPIVS